MCILLLDKVLYKCQDKFADFRISFLISPDMPFIKKEKLKSPAVILDLAFSFAVSLLHENSHCCFPTQFPYMNELMSTQLTTRDLPADLPTGSLCRSVCALPCVIQLPLSPCTLSLPSEVQSSAGLCLGLPHLCWDSKYLTRQFTMAIVGLPSFISCLSGITVLHRLMFSALQTIVSLFLVCFMVVSGRKVNPNPVNPSCSEVKVGILCIRLWVSIFPLSINSYMYLKHFDYQSDKISLLASNES